jgi:ABC-type multidrug transport system ATPase subunit
MTSVIAATAIGYTYPGGRTALAGLDLRLEPGEALGVIGPNGSGKSTLLRLLAGSELPTTGRIAGSTDRRSTAVVFDRTPFASSLSGRENVRRQLALRGIPAGPAAASADALLRDLGLADRSQDAAAIYSTGMARRLALAEALAAEARLLILDEPTLGLDVEGRSSLVHLVRGVVAGGRSVVLASNEPGFVAEACDRVLLLHRGRCVAEGTPPELIDRLGRPVLIDVQLRGPVPDSSGDEPPAAVQRLAAEGGTLRFATSEGSAVLPGLCEWLVGRGLDVRAIRIHEPDLGHVFETLTGVALDPNRTRGGLS